MIKIPGLPEGVGRAEIEDWAGAHCPDGWSWPYPPGDLGTAKAVVLGLLGEIDRLRQICANAVEMGLQHDDVVPVLEVLDAALPRRGQQ